jgi:hypothetical protein
VTFAVDWNNGAAIVRHKATGKQQTISAWRRPNDAEIEYTKQKMLREIARSNNN